MQSNTSNTLIVKITHGKDIRRFTTNLETFTWPSLSERVANYFDLGDVPFKLTYVDDENDNITLASDEELAEAITLANLGKPPILRLSVQEKKRKKEAATGADTAACNERVPCTERPTSTESSAPVELGPFFESLVKQMPAAIASLPEALRAMGPQMEVDLDGTLAASLAATQAARAEGTTDKTPQATVIDPFCSFHPHLAGATPGVHDGVTCDKSGQCPLVGNRYHLIGHNYDLCEAEFLKLPEAEQAKFRKVPPPPTPIKGSPAVAKATAKQPAPSKPDHGNGMHPGIECDKSGQCPIIGMRYHLRGHNYDLCQNEFDKLPAEEQAKFEAIAPPFQVPPCLAQAAKEMMHGSGMAAAMGGGGGGGWGSGMAAAMGSGGGGGWGSGGWGGGSWRPGPHGWRARANGGYCKMPEPPACPKPAARFVRDVSIFDGTQMSPGTPFTKIWRLKNVGDIPWPPGTKMLFVGGDAMTTQMEVPLTRDSPVLPGEEVDVAVEMMAPADHGRYLGYWRLTGPHGRRKFGQRVWCHIQVVDPDQSPLSQFDDLSATLAEIESKKKSLADKDKDDADDEPTDDNVAAVQASAAAANVEAAEVAEAKDGTLSDDGVLIDADSATEDGAEAAIEMAMAPSADAVTNTPANPGPSGVPPMPTPDPVDTSTRAALFGMGFADCALVDAVIAKNGDDDLDACARDLASAAEWVSLLDDLEEMGFGNRELNASLMLKNGGNIKRTVKDLVEA